MNNEHPEQEIRCISKIKKFLFIELTESVKDIDHRRVLATLVACLFNHAVDNVSIEFHSSCPSFVGLVP